MRFSRAFMGLAFSLLSLLAACGARSIVDGDTPAGDTPDPGDTPEPLAVYAVGSSGCAAAVDVESAEDALTATIDDTIVVVEIFFDIECTGLGGDYILARELTGSRTYWLGGHGCEIFGDPPPTDEKLGVLRYSQTAALFQTNEGDCIGFPGEPDGVVTDSISRAIATFATEDEAQAFADALASP